MAREFALRSRSVEIDPDPLRSATLPSWAYTDPAIFEREKEAIFFRTWQYAGAADQVAKPGDYITAQILDQSVIIVRGRDGELRGFHNVCQHRGHQLLKDCGHTSLITCPYHAWSYATDGTLRAARGAEHMHDFRHEDFRLKPVRVEVFADLFVFYNLDPDAEPLGETAAGLAHEIRTRTPGFAGLRSVSGARAASEIGSNWKVALDNFLECYHCPSSHPAFSELLAMNTFETVSHGSWTCQVASVKRADNKAYRVAPDEAGQQGIFWWLWPSTSFNIVPGDPGGLGVAVFQPGAHAVTRQWGQAFVPAGAERNLAREAFFANVLGPEDQAICESVQRGLASRGYDRGRFVHDPAGGEVTELLVHNFHRRVADALGL